MSVIWKDKVCEVSLDNECVEGLESGLFEDLKFRPNKYFHPIEDVQVSSAECKIVYQRELASVDGRVPLVQVLQVLEGAVDATQRLAQDQIFFLYPDVDAFVLDRRRNLRIGLINVRPRKDRERNSQEMCVDAFIQLLAAHCPEGHRRVVSYNKPILTLRHLQQVLTRKGSSPLLISILVLLILGSLTYGALLQWGPPRVQKMLRSSTAKVLSFGKRVLRSGTDEWHAQAREERHQREYKYPPIPMTLILNPKTATQAQNDKLYGMLTKFLMEEFPAKGKPRIRYQLLVPDATKFPKAHAQWKLLCEGAYAKRCQPQSWLLHFPAYPGGWRPLVEGIRETLREARSKAAGKPITKDLMTIRFAAMTGVLTLGYKAGAKPSKAQPLPRRRTKGPARPGARVVPRPTQARLLVPRRQPLVPARPLAPTRSPSPTRPELDRPAPARPALLQPPGPGTPRVVPRPPARSDGAGRDIPPARR